MKIVFYFQNLKLGKIFTFLLAVNYLYIKLGSASRNKYMYYVLFNLCLERGWGLFLTKRQVCRER